MSLHDDAEPEAVEQEARVIVLRHEQREPVPPNTQVAGHYAEGYDKTSAPPDELPLLNGFDLRDMANRARRRKCPVVPDKRLIELLDTGGVSVLVDAYPQTAGYWRCLLLCKLDGVEEPNRVWVDILSEDFARISTMGEYRNGERKPAERPHQLPAPRK